MKKYVFILLSLIVLTLTARAQKPARVPAYPGQIARVQPDGDTLHVFLRGDEHMHFMMTIDGWQIRENDKEQICYCRRRVVKKDGKKQIVPVVTRRQAHDADKRTKCEKRWLERHGIRKV